MRRRIGVMGLIRLIRPMGPIGPIRLIRLIGLMGLIGLIGCDSREEPEAAVVEQQVAITLSGAMKEEQAVTRAALSDEVTTFTVYGFKNTGEDTYQQVFPGYRVQWKENTIATTTTNSAGWEYVDQQLPGGLQQTIKYWDYGATAYRFMAVTGTGVTGEIKSHEANGTIGAYTAYELKFTANADSEADEAATPYYSHLWYRNISSPDIGKAVQLEFLKPFCKVRFMFTFEEPAKAAETTLTDKSFHPSDGNVIGRKGDVVVSYPLTGTATTETLTVSGNAGGLEGLTQDYYESVTKTGDHVTGPYYDAAETPLEKWYTVLSAPEGQGTYTLEVSVDGDPKTAVVPAEFMTWLPGYSYTYIFKVHVDGSVAIDNVQSAFTGWTDHGAKRTVYNW